jgi:hypothetical protein
VTSALRVGVIGSGTTTGAPTTASTGRFWGSDPDRGMLAEFVVGCRDDREPAGMGVDG